MGPATVVYARRQPGLPGAGRKVIQHESIYFHHHAWVNIRIALSMLLRLVSKVDGQHWRQYSAGKSYLTARFESPIWINLLRKTSSLSFRPAVRSLTNTFSNRFLSTYQSKGNSKEFKRELVLSPLILESGFDKIIALISALSDPAQSIVAQRHLISKALMRISQLRYPVKAADLSQAGQEHRPFFLKTIHRDIWKKWQKFQKQGVSSVVETFMPSRPLTNKAVFLANFTGILFAPEKQRQISGISQRPKTAAQEIESSIDHSFAGSNSLSFHNATHYHSNLARRIKPQPMRTQAFRAVHSMVEAAEKPHHRNMAIYKSQVALQDLDTRFRGYDRFLRLSGHSRVGANPVVARDRRRPTGFFESPVEGQGHFDLINSIFKPQNGSRTIDNENRQASEPPATVYAELPRLVHSANQTAGSRQPHFNPSEVQQSRPPKKITSQATKAAGDMATKVEHPVSGNRTAQAPAVDINELAGKVYDQIERRIQTEKERRGL